MSASRNLCNKKPIDYSKLHAGMSQSSSDSDAEGMDFSADIEGKRNLCGSFDKQEEINYKKHVNEQEDSSGDEEGEVHSDEEASEEEDKEDEEVKKCIKTGNLEKLKKILKRGKRTVRNWKKRCRRRNNMKRRTKR